MNDNCITNLHDPKTSQDAATKNYVDTKYIKNNAGLVPDLTSNDKNKSGFIVSASTEQQDKKAFNVFNSRKSEWLSSEDKNFWIQLKCPEPIIVHKFALKGNGQIYSWILQARNEYTMWNDLHVETNKFIGGDSVCIFNVNPSIVYIYFRIFVIKAEGETPGLSYWQLYTLDPILS
jgi:hypothetical protein